VTEHDPMVLLDPSLHPDNHLSHFDALRLMYARTAGHGELAAAVRAVLALHTIQPGPGEPDPGCDFCHGAGQADVDDLGAQHCHCRCDCCLCGDALCAGPCETLEAFLVASVLRGTPAGAVNVARTLDRLHYGAVQQVVTITVKRHLGAVAYTPIVYRDQDRPQAFIVPDLGAATAAMVEKALRRRGYRADRILPDLVSGVRLRVFPPDEPAG
jgi:hypothetical protein